MKKAMIFAAGLGTRLAPLTSDRPKALVELNGRALLWHVVERLADEGFTDLTVNVHHFAQQIKDYVAGGPFADYASSRGIRIAISDESDDLLDTGGGLRKATPQLFAHNDEPVLIHNVDILSNAKLSELYNAVRQNSALLLVSQRETTRYLLFNDDMRLVGWQNIQTGEVRTPYPDLNPDLCKRLAFSGIHVATKRLVEAMDRWPDKFGIIDFYIQNCRDFAICGYEQTDLQLTDIGKIDVLRKLEAPRQNLISLIIPVHNRREMLPRLFSSIRRIEGCEVELLLVDNNCDPDTRADLQTFTNKLNTTKPHLNTRLLTEPYPSAAAARNRGLYNARGEYVYFFDSDDEFSPQMLTDALALAKAEGADAIGVQVKYVWPDSRTKARHMRRTSSPACHIAANNFATVSLFLRRTFVQQHGRWNDNLRYWDDQEWALRLLLAKPKMAWLNQTYHQIHIHTNSITGSRFADSADKIIAAHSAMERDIRREELGVRTNLRALNCRKALYAGRVKHEGDNKAAHLIYNSIDRSVCTFIDRVKLPLLYRLSGWGVRGLYRLA